MNVIHILLYFFEIRRFAEMQLDKSYSENMLQDKIIISDDKIKII